VTGNGSLGFGGGDRRSAHRRGVLGQAPFVTLVLGISVTVLGLTVVWFCAAIPLGIAAVVVGVMANRQGVEGRHHTRAVLGTVAILLGVTGAAFMPRLPTRTNAALSNVENDVTADIEMIDDSVSSDVNRIDKSIARDLSALESSLRMADQSLVRELSSLEARVDALVRKVGL